MDYTKRGPCKVIGDSVESYIFYQAENLPAVTDIFFPNGNPAIIFHFENPFKYRNKSQQWIPMDRISFIGCISIPVAIKNEGKVETLVVKLYPYSIYNMYSLTINSSPYAINAKSLFPDDFYRKIKSCNSMNSRLDLLNVFFSEKLIKYDPEKDIFKKICNYIIQKKGLVERKNIAKTFSISESYVHKLFTKKIGLSVKPYSQIVRISNILEEIYHANNKDWFDILLKYEYYDQAHFIKDFKKITNKTPLQYFRSDKTFSAMFSAIA